MQFKLLSETTPVNALPTDSFGDKGEFKLWLLVQALQEQELQLSRTLVLLEDEEIIGFLNTRLGPYSDDVDGVLVKAKWVVLKKFQNQGHDKTLLLRCLQDAQKLLQLVPFAGILGHTSDKTSSLYKRVGFVHIFGSKFLLTSDKIEEAIQKLHSLTSSQA